MWVPGIILFVIACLVLPNCNLIMSFFKSLQSLKGDSLGQKELRAQKREQDTCSAVPSKLLMSNGGLYLNEYCLSWWAPGSCSNMDTTDSCRKTTKKSSKSSFYCLLYITAKGWLLSCHNCHLCSWHHQLRQQQNNDDDVIIIMRSL